MLVCGSVHNENSAWKWNIMVSKKESPEGSFSGFICFISRVFLCFNICSCLDGLKPPNYWQ